MDPAVVPPPVSAPERANVRILSATHRRLKEMVDQHLFREDLYYRLNTLAIEVPPLRMRGADVDLLAQHFVAVFNERFGSSKRIGEAALAS